MKRKQTASPTHIRPRRTERRPDLWLSGVFFFPSKAESLFLPPQHDGNCLDWSGGRAKCDLHPRGGGGGSCSNSQVMNRAAGFFFGRRKERGEKKALTVTVFCRSVEQHEGFLKRDDPLVEPFRFCSIVYVGASGGRELIKAEE